MSGTGGFWPGEAPAAEEEQAQESGRRSRAAQLAGAEPRRGRSRRIGARAGATAAGRDGARTTAAEPEAEVEEEPEPPAAGHVPGELDIPDGVAVLEGSPSGRGPHGRRRRLALQRRDLEPAARVGARGARRRRRAEERITVMPVPGAFELPIGAMALAKTRRYSCVIALGCVVRGETAHFDYVAGEAASGLQLAGLETGVPVRSASSPWTRPSRRGARSTRAPDAARGPRARDGRPSS